MVAIAQALAFPAVFLPQVANANQTMYMDRDTGSWFNSVNSLSAPIGSIVIGMVMDRFGRKVALAIPMIPMIVAHLATALSQTNVMLICSRIALGLCLGCLPPVCQVSSSLSHSCHPFWGDSAQITRKSPIFAGSAFLSFFCFWFTFVSITDLYCRMRWLEFTWRHYEHKLRITFDRISVGIRLGLSVCLENHIVCIHHFTGHDMHWFVLPARNASLAGTPWSTNKSL